MKSLHTVRHAILTTAAVAAMTFPLIGTAGLLDDPNAQSAIQSLDLSDTRDQQEFYERLQNQSRKICGSTSIRVTGSVERSMQNEECYDETLSAAIGRVDNSAIEELHQRSSTES